MRSGSLLLPAFLGASALSGCNGDRVGAPDQGTDGGVLAVASPNRVVGVTAGAPVSYDATQGGATFTPSAARLEYSIRFEGPSNGLSARGGTVEGQPASPGVVWLTILATDTAAGREASDRFAVVAFAPGLRSPTLPPTPFHYSDAAVPLPAHFRAVVDGASAAATDNTPADDPITDAGAALGRVLFYDPVSRPTTNAPARDATNRRSVSPTRRHEASGSTAAERSGTRRA